MLLTPALFILYDKVIAPQFANDRLSEADDFEKTGQVLIAGHGRIGGIVSRMLRGAGYSTTVVDFSTSQLEMLRIFGVKAYFGAATRPDLLEAAGIRKASLFVAAIDDKHQLTELVKYVRSIGQQRTLCCQG